MRSVITHIEDATGSVAYKLNSLTELTIKSSYETLTDTAVLSFPRGLRVLERTTEGSVEHVTGVNIDRGSYVEIWCEYDSVEHKKSRFQGYVTRVDPGQPVRIHLEDSAYLLKNGRQKFSLKEGKIEDIISPAAAILPTTSVEVKIYVKFKSDGLTPAQILEKLKRQYQLQSFIHDKRLYIGQRFWPEYRTEHILDFNYNILEERLEYYTTDDLDVTVRATSTYPNAGKDEQISVEVGGGGEQFRTLNFYGITDEAVLRSIAENELGRMTFEGL